MDEKETVMNQKIPARSEIATEDTWDVESIFPSPAAWEEAMAAAPAQVAREVVSFS